MIFMGKIAILYDRILSIMAVISGVMVGFMMLAVSYSVIMRYFFNSPSAWVMEITTYLLLYIAFLGAPWLLRHGGHVNVDLLLNRLSPGKQGVINIFTLSLGFVISLLLFKYGFEVTLDHYMRKVEIMSILATPKYLLLASIPIGSLFLILEFARQTVLQVRRLKSTI